jgi:hypothetical protein
VADPMVEEQQRRGSSQRGTSPQPHPVSVGGSSVPTRAAPPRPQGGPTRGESRPPQSARGSVTSSAASDKSYAARMRMAASGGSASQPPSRGSFSSRTSKPIR